MDSASILKGERRTKNRSIVFLVLALVSTSVFLSVRPVFAAKIFEDGFESGDFSAWTSTTGSPTVTSSTSHHGTYSASFDAGEYCRKNYGGTNNVIYARFCMKWSNSLLSGNSFHINLLGISGVSNIFRVLLSHNGIDVVWGITVRENTVFNTYYSTQQKNPSTNTWYCTEIMADMSTNNGLTDGNYRIWINGNELTDIARTNIDTDYTYTDCMVTGTEAFDYGGTVYLDCFVVDTAYIGPESYTLTASVVGQGSVSKSPDQATYDWGTNVELTAHANVGWTFAGWSGGASGTSSPVTVTITDDTAVTATFTQNPAPPVGGEWAPIDKLQLSTPWMSWISLMTILTASFVYVRRKRHRSIKHHADAPLSQRAPLY